MDIAQLSLTTSQNSLMNQVGLAMLSKSLEDLQANGAEMAKMMEQSVNPELGSNIDIQI